MKNVDHSVRVNEAQTLVASITMEHSVSPAPNN